MNKFCQNLSTLLLSNLYYHMPENFEVANLVNRKPFANSFVESVLAKHGAYQKFPTYGISRG